MSSTSHRKHVFFSEDFLVPKQTTLVLNGSGRGLVNFPTWQNVGKKAAANYLETARDSDLLILYKIVELNELYKS